MARITAASEERVFQIKQWLGLNESANGDTKLRMGEATSCTNFRVTRDGNLQKRPGTKTMVTLGVGAVKGLWSGNVQGVPVLLGACDGKLYSLLSASGEYQKIELGSVSTAGTVFIFGFSENAYIMTGTEYKVWDGQTLSDVEGYRPLVAVAVTPNEGGSLLEEINKLNGLRRCWISPDGTASTFKLPEKGLASVDYVKDLTSGEEITAYTADLAGGTVTFNSAPAANTNAYEIGWTVSENYAATVRGMRFAELYNGTQDTRVFIYGDGSNEAFYSGIDYDGKARADYFPDMNEIAVGEANTPITAMIRHFSRLMCFKTDSAYSISYGNITLDDGNVKAAFYLTAVNKAIGCQAPGQARLVLNSPRTLHGKDVYEWKNNASYSAGLSIDERQAQRISDRITATLERYALPACFCFDDNDSQEYYICYNGTALVHNYAVNAWYYYTGFDVASMARAGSKLIIGTSHGRLKEISYRYKGDDEEPIDCYWQSGAMSFNKDFKRKYSAVLWIGVAPESKSSITVNIETDRDAVLQEKSVIEALMWFDDIDFGNFSFQFYAKPKVHKLKIKAKKFVYYRLIFKSKTNDASATLTTADIKVRYTGDAKS